MLPTNRRVKKEAFAQIMKEGLFVSGDNFYLRLLDRQDSQPSLFGFVVPIKVKKTSAGRHFIKRKMSASVETVICQTKSGLSVVFFAKKDPLPPYIQITTEILALLKKAKVLKEGKN